MSILGNNKKQSFGVFISTKRIEKRISLRQFAKSIQISPEYLSKIENELRAVPKDEIVKKIAEQLHLNSGEKEIFFDLAAQTKSECFIAVDLAEYINSHPVIYRTLRLSKRMRSQNTNASFMLNTILTIFSEQRVSL